MASNHWGTSRVEAFSDGVFAIAITLLVLDISVPESEFDDLWRGIGDQWPSYLAYVTSFSAIGGMWLSHHGIFRRLQAVNDPVMRINLLLLMAVGFLPFPTRLAAEAIGNDDAERAAVIFYGLTLVLIALLFRVLWGAIMRDRDLLLPDVDDEEIRYISRRTTPNLVFYFWATALAVVRPNAAAILYLVIAVMAVIRAPGSGRRPHRVEAAAD